MEGSNWQSIVINPNKIVNDNTLPSIVIAYPNTITRLDTAPTSTLKQTSYEIFIAVGKNLHDFSETAEVYLIALNLLNKERIVREYSCVVVINVSQGFFLRSIVFEESQFCELLRAELLIDNFFILLGLLVDMRPVNLLKNRSSLRLFPCLLTHIERVKFV